MADFPGNFDRYLVGHLDGDLGALFHWHWHLMALVPRNLFTVLVWHLDRYLVARLLWHIVTFFYWLLDRHLDTILLGNLVALLVVSVSMALLPIISVTLLGVRCLVGGGTNRLVACRTLIFVLGSCGWLTFVFPEGDTFLLVIVVGGTLGLICCLVLGRVLGVVDRLAFWFVPVLMSMFVPVALVVVALDRGGKQGRSHKLK